MPAITVKMRLMDKQVRTPNVVVRFEPAREIVAVGKPAAALSADVLVASGVHTIQFLLTPEAAALLDANKVYDVAFEESK